MTLRHMEIFKSVCENGCNTTKAADALHMTQPAVSLAIKELESFYGTVLFDRIGRRLRLTKAGEELLQYTIHICGMFNDLEMRLRNWDRHGVLRVGASLTIGSQFMPVFVREFSKTHSDIEVYVQIAPSSELERLLMANELDFALMEGTPHEAALRYEPFMEDELTMIVPCDSPYENDSRLSLEELKRQKLLLRERGSGTREVFEQAMAEKSVKIEPLWEARSTTALINAVINGIGAAVLPKRRVRDYVESGLIKSVRIEGISFHRYFYLVRHKDKFLSASAKAFMKLCYERGIEEGEA